LQGGGSKRSWRARIAYDIRAVPGADGGGGTRRGKGVQGADSGGAAV
jgi:hypothetical protein